MIKKILLSLGIITTLLINFSYGIDYTRCVLNNITAGLSLQMTEKNGALRQSQNEGNYYLGVFNKGELLTHHGPIQKKLLSVNSNTLFFRDENGYPYLFWNNTNQGNYSYYYECDEITYSGRIPSLGCGSQSYEINSGTIEYFKEFFSSITDDDYFGYNKDHRGGGIEYCFSSHYYGATLCFDYSNSANTECPLRNSKNYQSLTVDNISSDILYDGPGFMFTGGTNTGGTNTGFIDSNISYTCTKEIALKWYEKNGYSSKLCYGGFNNFNLFTGAINDLPFYGSGLDIEEIWFNTAQYRIYGDTGTGMGYNDWFHYWRLVYNSYYRTINQGGVMDNPFNNTPLVLFTYFSAVNQFGRNLKDKDILEYCDLKLYTVDYSAVYSGNYGDRVCSPLVWLEESVNHLNSSGDVNVGVNINGNFGSGSSGSGNSGQNFTDGQSFIQSFVKFINSDKFNGTNTGSNGIIPGYIVLVLCALLFFRFLMH